MSLAAPAATDTRGVELAGPFTGGTVSPARPNERAILRADVLQHLNTLSLPALQQQDAGAPAGKAGIRGSHAPQRADVHRREQRALAPHWSTLLTHFADGCEVCPERIDPELVPVRSDDETGEVFRIATLLWSVPVSHGFGRRMRYLVRDRSNGKLIGIFALGDPVFNLRARDAWIGWGVRDREARLVHVMDAYVVGAVPPYAHLLGGKLVAALIGSAEVGAAFSARYGGTTGIISGVQKTAQLAIVTTTSALGRSSLYNRLRLKEPGDQDGEQQTLVDLVRIGATQGFGHFQLSDSLFERLRRVLVDDGHAYAAGHQFGQGPNWRLRVARVSLQKVGLNPALLRHGIRRDVYAMPLASNFREFLCGTAQQPELQRPCAARIASAALERWVLPRAVRRPEYASFRREQLPEFTQCRLTTAPFTAVRAEWG